MAAPALHDVSCVAHVHTTYSDGTATVPELLDAARAAGVDVTMSEYADVEHIWILNGPFRLRYGARYPEDGVEWFDCGHEPPEAITAIDEMCAFVRRHVG